jgi:hypothetical protein
MYGEGLSLPGLLRHLRRLGGFLIEDRTSKGFTAVPVRVDHKDIGWFTEGNEEADTIDVYIENIRPIYF